MAAPRDFLSVIASPQSDAIKIVAFADQLK